MPELTRRRLIVSTALLAAGASGGAFALMTVKDQTYVPSDPYAPSGAANREVAVVYYSRTGHSEAVAREIARAFNAPIARISADYPLDYSGQAKAVSDAEAKVLPEIQVEPIRLDSARSVYLVAPTWWFGPATPLWSYVEEADLADKEVALVTTGNSRFEQHRIDAFAERVSARGGELVRHVFLRRGRIYWQMSRERLLHEARARVVALRDAPRQGG